MSALRLSPVTEAELAGQARQAIARDASRASWDEWANLTALDIAAVLAVPMSAIDGRPWVPTEAEAL
jgi:hypothetical protein